METLDGNYNPDPVPTGPFTRYISQFYNEDFETGITLESGEEDTGRLINAKDDNLHMNIAFNRLNVRPVRYGAFKNQHCPEMPFIFSQEANDLVSTIVYPRDGFGGGIPGPTPGAPGPMSKFFRWGCEQPTLDGNPVPASRAEALEIGGGLLGPVIVGVTVTDPQGGVPQLSLFEKRDSTNEFYDDGTSYTLSAAGIVEFTYFVPTTSSLVGKFWHIGTSFAANLPETDPQHDPASSWGKSYSYSGDGVQIVGGQWTKAVLSYGSSNGGQDLVDEAIAGQFRGSATKNNRFIVPLDRQVWTHTTAEACSGIQANLDESYAIAQYQIKTNTNPDPGPTDEANSRPNENLYLKDKAFWTAQTTSGVVQFRINPRNPLIPLGGSGPEYYQWSLKFINGSSEIFASNNTRWPWQADWSMFGNLANATFDASNALSTDASTNRGKNLISHHVYHTQMHNVDKHADPLNQVYNTVKNLSSIDCSNIDIIVNDTGLDRTHIDINENLIEFDWTRLSTAPDGVTLSETYTQIISSVPESWYIDANGHGTACASLICGKRSGMAKGANLYCIGGLLESSTLISMDECLKLIAAFQKAKK